MSTAEKFPEFKNEKEDDDWDFNLDDVEVATFGTKEYLDETNKEILDLRDRLKEIKGELMKQYPNAERYSKLERDSEIKSGDNKHVKHLLRKYNETKDILRLKNKRLHEAEEVFRSNLGPKKEEDPRHGMRAVPDLREDETVQESEDESPVEEVPIKDLDRATREKMAMEEINELRKQRAQEKERRQKEIDDAVGEISDETIEFEVPMIQKESSTLDKLEKNQEVPTESEVPQEALNEKEVALEDSDQEKDTMDRESEIVNEIDEGESGEERFNFAQLEEVLSDVPSREEITELEEEKEKIPDEIKALSSTRLKLEAGGKPKKPGLLGRLFGNPDMSKYTSVDDVRRAERELPERLKQIPDIIDEKTQRLENAHDLFIKMGDRLDTLGNKKNKTTEDWMEMEKIRSEMERLDKALRFGSKKEKLKKAA